MSHDTPYITVAAGQLSARLMNEASTTLDAIERMVAQAAEQGVQLLVLPECAYPAYLLGSIQSYRIGDHLSGKAFVARLCDLAARYSLHIVSGFVEDTEQALYNSAVFIDSTGREIGRRRKIFLWHVGHEWYSPGDKICAFDSALGRIGIIICAETRVPEILATLVADGAELMAMPTCWVNTANEPGKYANIQTEYLIEARAREFGIPFVCADKSGMELPPVSYVGQSRIVLGDGRTVTEAPPTGEMLITAQISLHTPCELSITHSQRARLTATSPACCPEATNPRPVDVAIIPGKRVKDRIANQGPEDFFQSLKAQNVRLLMTSIQERAAQRALVEAGRRLGLDVLAFAEEEKVFSLAGGQVGCSAGRQSLSFARSRVQALNGAEVLCFFDTPMDLPVLRSRAVENRVFVFGANEQEAVLIGPDGVVRKVTDSQQLEDIIAEIDLAEAGNKLVAPRTDVFAARRPTAYRF